jgi:phenylalanyl-tRNA synthetase beta subunit
MDCRSTYPRNYSFDINIQPDIQEQIYRGSGKLEFQSTLLNLTADEIIVAG